jgi:hypothetical protein
MKKVNTTDLAKLVDFFETNDFNVYQFEQDNENCAEIEIWTDGGVDMIITLQPFTSKEFIEYVNDFNVDNQVDFHRQDERYRKDFSISESLKDFKKFHKHLKNIVSKLKKENL